MTDKSNKYQILAKLGTSARAIYLTARADGLNAIEAIKLIREIFGLSLVEAKEVAVTADGRFSSLSDYQASLIPALKKALYVLEQEEQGKLFVEIKWREVSVGYALLDFTPAECSGEWLPLDTPPTTDFLTAVQSLSGAEVEFGQQKLRGVINTDPTLTGIVHIKL